MDTTTIAYTGEVRQRLVEQLRSAWRSRQPSEPRDAWLESTVAALTVPADTSDTAEANFAAAAGALTSWTDAVEAERVVLDVALAQILPLRAETERLTAATTATRAQLIELRHRVRVRAIEQLDESPPLREPLSVALADWDLPAISDEADDEPAVEPGPTGLAAAATGGDDDRRASAAFALRVYVVHQLLARSDQHTEQHTDPGIVPLETLAAVLVEGGMPIPAGSVADRLLADAVGHARAARDQAQAEFGDAEAACAGFVADVRRRAAKAVADDLICVWGTNRALDAWGMPPLVAEHHVDVRITVRVAVAAADRAEAFDTAERHVRGVLVAGPDVDVQLVEGYDAWRTGRYRDR